MKRFAMLLMCLFVVFMSANAQRIKRDEIDKFTKKRVIETSFKEISGSDSQSERISGLLLRKMEIWNICVSNGVVTIYLL